MKNIEKCYNNTESEKPRNNVQYCIDKVKCTLGKAIELCCSAESDTIYLIKNNWNVLAVDRESNKNLYIRTGIVLISSNAKRDE